MPRKRKKPKQSSNFISTESTIRKLTTELVDPRVLSWLWRGSRGVRQRLLKINFEVLRNLVDKIPLMGGIINTRTDQIQPFCHVAMEKGDTGFRFDLIDPLHKHEGDVDEDEIAELSRFIDQTGFMYDPEREDDFADYCSMFVRETYTIDQVATEIQRNRLDEMIAFWLLDGSCYSDDTEILTEKRGWILFKDLNGDDLVATRSKANVFEWQQPTDYVARPYKGKMVHFNQRSMDILVHPDHRMLYERKRYSSGCVRITSGIKAAKDIAYKHGYNVPMQSVWQGTMGEYTEKIEIGGKTVSLKDWMAFLGIYLSDGCTSGSMGNKNKYAKAVYISRPKGTHYYKDIKDLLENRLPFNFKLQTNEKNFYVIDHALWNILHNLGNVYTKYVPNGIKNLPAEYLSVLWEWALKGDGSESATKSGRIERSLTTVSYRLASDYQEIIQKIGLSASITKKKIPKVFPIFKTHRVKSMKQAYIVSELVSKVRALRGKNVDYSGMIYCVTVPNEILYTRRNGYAAWCGNTIKRVSDEHDFKRGIRFVQEIEDKIYAEYTSEDLLFDYKYKRADIRQRGYGFSLVEQCLDIITTLLFGYNYIRDQLIRDRVPKGFISVMGDAGKTQLDAIRSYWYAAMSGAGGQWNIPILPSGKDGVGIDFKTLGHNNKDMEYHKTMMFVSSLVAAVASIDLTELGIKPENSTAIIGENMEPRLQASKDRGLKGMLAFLEQHVNKIVRKTTTKYRFEFVGLEKEDEEKKGKIRKTQLDTYRTVDEIREEDGLKPFKEDWSTLPLHSGIIQLFMQSKGIEMGDTGSFGEYDENGQDQENDNEGEDKEQGETPFKKSIEDFRNLTRNKQERIIRHIIK